jgi:hypothetical protein
MTPALVDDQKDRDRLLLHGPPSVAPAYIRRHQSAVDRDLGKSFC